MHRARMRCAASAGSSATTSEGDDVSFLFMVTMEGRLDPDWVTKQLGDKPEKGKKSGGTAGAK